MKLRAEPRQWRFELVQDLGGEGEAAVNMLAVPPPQERKADGERQAASLLRGGSTKSLWLLLSFLSYSSNQESSRFNADRLSWSQTNYCTYRESRQLLN